MRGIVNMKKINILDLLCDDLIEQTNKEKNNLYAFVNESNINKFAKLYIIPYLNDNYKLFELDFDFNINSSDEIVKYKSLLLTNLTINGVYDLISDMPDYFKECEKQYNTQIAIEEMCLRVLIGNILDIKKNLKEFKLDRSIKDFLDKLNEILKNS